MAATTVNRQPADGEADIHLRDRLAFQWDLYSGAGALVNQRIKIYSDAGGTVTVYDSLLAPMLSGVSGDGWMEVEIDAIPLESLTDYWWGVTVEDSVPSTSTQSALTKFTTGAAPVTSLRLGQVA